MTIVAPTRHVLRIADLRHAELAALLELAARMKADPGGWTDALRGQSVAGYFTRPSTRTRVSLQAACWRLGALPIVLRPDDLEREPGEPIGDIARVLSTYCAAIVMRTYAQADVEAVAAASAVPVVNALTDQHAPGQALADLLTLRERFGTLAGLRIGFIGGGNNVAHSLLEAGALSGMHVTIGSPVGFWPRGGVIERATAFARHCGGSVSVVSDPRDAAAGAQAVYADIWVSTSDERGASARPSELARFRVDAQLMEEAADDAVFLHCLPAHRGEEVAGDIIDGPSSAVWDQAANRLPTMQALLYALVTGDWAGERV